MSGFDAHGISTRFGAPGRYQPIAMIAMGYPGAANLLDEKQAARQAQPRRREPLSEWLFIGRWGSAYPATGDLE